jgi:serine protease Do
MGVMEKQGITRKIKGKLSSLKGTYGAGLRDRSRSLGVALLLLASLSLGFFGGRLGSQNRDETGTALNTASQRVITSESQLISDIAKNVGASVVSVNTVAQTQQTDFFGFSSQGQEEGAGTGIIISEDGYIITNRHVVPAGTTNVSVTLSDGTQLDNVEVVGRTNESDPLDVAFLKVKDAKGKKLTAAKIGDSSKMEVGDRVVAIGNALGQFQNSVTTGIISGYGREVQASDSSGSNPETLQNLFQTDAAINQGNSGGPLVNVSGEVIGINTAVAGGEAQNIGFAIPINDAKGLIGSVLEKGKLERPYLGVRYISLTDDYAYQYNLSVKRGAYIAPSRGQSSILPNSPAAKAGLQEKDIITKIDGTAIDEKNSVASLIGRKSVGDEASLTVIRDGKEQTVKVKLEAAPQQ